MQTHPSDRHPWSFLGGWHVPRAEGASAYGPQPKHLIGDEEALDLVRHRKVLQEDPRRQAAWERFLVLIEQHKALVRQRVCLIFKDEQTRKQVLEHADASVNLARDVVKDLCCVWKHDAKRSIKDASDSETEAFLKLVDESKFASHARAWNRFAFYEGPTTVIPVIRAERLTWDTLLPHAYDVRQNPDDQWGAPLAAIWDAWKPATMADLPPERRPDADAVVLDGESWKYISLARGDATSGETVKSVPHGLDVFPGATLRFDEFGYGDWWGIDQHVRLQDATMQIGFICAILGYVRKSQNRKLLTAIGDIAGIPKGTVSNAEIPLEAQTKSPELVSINAIDLDQDPESFIKHASWLMSLVARSYGGTVTMGEHMSVAGGLLGSDVSFSYDIQTELRNEQIPQARDFERDLWVKAVGIAKENGHPLADDLPDPERVREGFNVEFPRLARSFANIDEEIKFWDFALKNGRAAYGDLMRAEMPLATDEDRDAAIMENIERCMPIVEAFTKRDLSMDPMASGDAALKTPAQQFGAKGPQVRDGKQPPPKEKPEEK